MVPTGRRQLFVREACGEIEAQGRKTLARAVDIGSRTSIDSLFEEVVSTFGRIDILINAAAITGRAATAAIAEDQWRSIFDTNVDGMLRTCQAAYPHMKANGSGRIINIASLSSFVAFHEVAAYGASKSAVLSLTRSLGCEWARDRINVNAIIPGVFRTDLNAAMLDGTDRGKELLLRTPMKRFGQSEELIGAAVFLASDAASFVTGQFIVVDGGFLASGVNS